MYYCTRPDGTIMWYCWLKRGYIVPATIAQLHADLLHERMKSPTPNLIALPSEHRNILAYDLNIFQISRSPLVSLSTKNHHFAMERHCSTGQTLGKEQAKTMTCRHLQRCFNDCPADQHDGSYSSHTQTAALTSNFSLVYARG